MSTLLRAEWRKVFTTKLWWGMLLGAMAFSSIAVVAQIASNGVARSSAPPLTTATTQQAIFASPASGYLFSVIVGIILMTTEYRHFTSRPTFLFEPRRGRVILAKIGVALAVGLIYGVCCVAITVAIAAPWLGVKHVEIGWTADDLVLVLVGGAAAVTVFTVVGLGVGVLVRNQVAAVIGTLAYLFVLEPLVAVIPVVKEAYRFLPGAASRAITEYGTSRNGIDVLDPWQGAFMLLGWGLLFAVLGWRLSVGRDVA